MIKYKRIIKYSIIIGVLLIVAVLLMHPLLFRERTIERLTRIELPATANIIEYRVSINPFVSFRDSWGFGQLYAKIKIDRYTFEAWTENRAVYGIELFDDLKRFKNDYESLNIERVKELWISDIMGSKLNFFTGTTGVVYIVITKEDEERYFMYVLF